MSLDVYTADTVRKCLSYMSDEKIAAYVQCDPKQVRRMRTRYLTAGREQVTHQRTVARKWSESDIRDIVERFQTQTGATIAKIYGVTEGAILGVVRRNGGAR